MKETCKMCGLEYLILTDHQYNDWTKKSMVVEVQGYKYHCNTETHRSVVQELLEIEKKKNEPLLTILGNISKSLDEIKK